MAKYKVISGGVCAAKGFSASGVHAGFRANPNKLDLAIIKADVRCAAAGVYTTNKVYGAPIKVDRAHLVDGHAQAVLVNSGNANTCAANGVDLANACVGSMNVTPSAIQCSLMRSRAIAVSCASWIRLLTPRPSR